MTGIYIISWINNEYFYVGQTQSFKQRKYQHWNNLKNQKHRNPRLQHVYNKYGEPLFQILEKCEVGELVQQEQLYLDLLFDDPNCLNLARYAETSMRGLKHSVETKNKIRKKAIGRRHSSETLHKLSDNKKGGKHNRAMPVLQYDLNNNLIAKFECIRDASIASGCTSSSIVLCCRNKRKTSKGYVWKYATEKRNTRVHG